MKVKVFNPAEAEAEGDRTTWHIRLRKRVAAHDGEVISETWQLYHGDTPRSSEVPKSAALQWRDEELAKEKKQ